jgi:hypothetical protein
MVGVFYFGLSVDNRCALPSPVQPILFRELLHFKVELRGGLRSGGSSVASFYSLQPDNRFLWCEFQRFFQPIVFFIRPDNNFFVNFRLRAFGKSLKRKSFLGNGKQEVC